MECLTPRLLWLLFVYSSTVPFIIDAKPGLDWDSWLRPSKPKCEPLKISACKDALYNMTIVPNSLGHRTQEEAEVELAYFTPLMKVRCSDYFQQFLCLLYAPVCTIIEKPILPCRSLCKKAKKGCVELMLKFGFHWPEVLRCSKFPKKRGNSICTGINGGKRNKKGKRKGGKKGRKKKGHKKASKNKNKRKQNKKGKKGKRKKWDGKTGRDDKTSMKEV